MDRRGNYPDVLANHIAHAVRAVQDAGYRSRVVYTAPPRGPGSGSQRVVRQRVADDGETLELTVTAEDWGKEV